MNDQKQAHGPDRTAVLPEIITRYLTAHRVRDADRVMSTFTRGATVIDDGKDYTGTEAIRQWLTRSASEYTYTIELTGSQKIDDIHYVATNHLEGASLARCFRACTSMLSRGDRQPHLETCVARP